MASVALAAALCCGTAHTQGRGPTAQELRNRAVDAATLPAAGMDELNAWLGRLVGRYRIAGFWGVPVKTVSFCENGRECNERLTQSVFEGSADCTRIGEGAGVNCIIGVAGAKRDGVFPKSMLFGVDPVLRRIRYMLMDNQGIVESEVGELSGESVTFRVTCPMIDIPMYNTLYCRREIRIRAPVDGETLQIWTRTDQPTGPVMGLQVVQGPTVEDMLLRRQP